MAMVVNHNLPATNAYRHLGINNSKMSKSIEKLSSGLAINRAGDDAAGLAVSEKMRAQISGLNQAVKNAQDGISMVQTYEGALTETDSILQRMRTLAAQSANGTYQDDVDREAIQLEFDQLNDELNQIADTDFNGVVVLNGGQMADGLKAVDGEFDYSNVTRLKKQLGSSDIKTIDNKGWSSANANAAWDSWSNGSFDRTDADRTNDGPAETDITFKYNAVDGTWSAISATNGMSVDSINNCVDNDAKNGAGTGTGANNGGFAITDGTNEVANIVLDASKLQDGDTITLNFKNPLAGKTAPENVGIKKDSIDTSGFTAGLDTTDATKTADATAVTVITNSTISSTNNPTTTFVTEDQAKLYELLDGAKVEATYTAGTVAATGFTLTLNDGTSIQSKANTAGTAFVVGGTTFYLGDKAGTAGTSGSELTINTKADGTGTNLLKFTAATGYNNTGAGNSATAGKVSYTLSVAQGKYDESGLAAEVVEPNVSQVSKSNSNDASKATMTYTDNITLQVGARTKDSVNFTFKYASNGLGELKADLDCSARGLGTDKLSLSTQKDANSAIDKIDNAINKVSMVRGSFGAMQNRLEHKVDNLNVASENLTAAESAIRDTDMAKEMMNFTKSQILSQASQAMLAQANQLPQGVLQLLQ